MAKKHEVSSVNILMGYIGVLITLVFELFLVKRAFWIDRGYRSSIILLGLAMFLGGFLFRVFRRKCFYGRSLSLHQAFSFESVFQGVNFIFPQIPYPDFERELLTKENIKPSSLISAWFEIRKSSAILILFVLSSIGFYYSPLHWMAYICAVFIPVSLYASWMIFNLRFRRSTFLSSLILGATASLVELIFFIFFMQLFVDNVSISYSVLLYTSIFILYEVTPIPMALGIVELLCILFSLLNLMPIEHSFFLLFYRLTRVFPTFLIMLFYLPRYKLSLYDIYHPDLVKSLTHDWSYDKSFGPFKNTECPYDLSIVIPAYNEQDRLDIFLKSVNDYIRSSDKIIEIIFVNDGSKDKTLEYMEKFKNSVKTATQIISYSDNQGKGYAVKQGMLRARGRWVLFTDADGATPICNIEKLLISASNGADIVIAIRQEDIIEVKRSFVRELLGQSFYRLTNLLAVPGIKDTQCGFKLFSNDAAQYIFSKIKETSWAFDVEALFIAQKQGMKVVEVPVEWREIEGSKIKVLPAAIQMFFALFRIRKRWKGYLEKSNTQLFKNERQY